MNGLLPSSTRQVIRSLLWLVISFSVAQHSWAADELTVLNTSVAAQQLSTTPLGNDVENLLLTSRIIGGRDVESNRWPSLVALVSTGFGTVKNRFFCGATVVAERWVMTAAHCVFGSFGQRIQPSGLRVIAGIRNLDNDVPEEEVSVTNIVVHPQYDSDLEPPPFDIALLELSSAINAPIVNLFSGDPADHNGDSGYIAGWGATRFVNENDATYPAQLQEAAVPIVSLARCNSIVSYQGLITHRQLCAGFIDGGVDACAGDSGGPLFTIEDGVIRQMGITSFGNGCALANFYGIYTSVSHLLPWLSDYIDVPVQTPELVARLDSGVMVVEPNPEPEPTPAPEPGRGGLFFGAIYHPLSGLVLLSFLLSRWHRFS